MNNKNNIPQTNHQKNLSDEKEQSFSSESCNSDVDFGVVDKTGENIPKKRRSKKLPVFVSEDDLLEILKVSKHKHHKLAYIISWYSGLRVSEVLNVEPRDIDMENKTLFVRQGKGGKDRVTILPKFFRKEMLELLPLSKFMKVRALQKAFKKACKESGVLANKPTIHFHSLRHGFCTHAVEKGIDITRIQVLAGHSNVATTSIYTHLNPKICIDEFRGKF